MVLLFIFIWLNINAIKLIKTELPVGTYGVPMKGSNKCDSGFKPGSRTRMLLDYHSSDANHLADIYSKDEKTLKIQFCMKTNLGTGPNWPKGVYCIYKYGSCPNGFIAGNIKWDDTAPIFLQNFRENKQKKDGILPDGIYDSNTLIEFCCRFDGQATIPVKSPFEGNFYLLQYGSVCQLFQGTTVTREWSISKDSSTLINLSVCKKPCPKFSMITDGEYRLHYCYYETKHNTKLKTFLTVVYVLGAILAICITLSCLLFLFRLYHQNRKLNRDIQQEAIDNHMLTSNEDNAVIDLQKSDDDLPKYEDVISDSKKYCSVNTQEKL